MITKFCFADLKKLVAILYNPELQLAFQAQQKLQLSTRNLTDAQKALQKIMQEGQQLTKSLRTPLEIYHEQLDKAGELLQNNAINQSTYNRAIKAASQTLKESITVSRAWEAQQRLAEQASQQFALIFSQGLFAFMEDGFDSMAKNFERALKRMAAMAASIELGKLLFGGTDIGGLLGNLFKAAPVVGQVSPIPTIPLPFGGAFADGGVVKGNIPIVVGEKGPELFMPRQAGTIVPNHQLTQQEARPIIINMNITTPDANSFRRSEASIGTDIVNFLARVRN